MAFIRNLNGIPLFSTTAEAVTWGKQNLGISTFHAHRYAGSNAFMAGANHDELIRAQEKRFNDSREGILQPVNQTVTTLPHAPLNTRRTIQQSSLPSTPTTTVYSGGSSRGGGGGGGGGGY